MTRSSRWRPGVEGHHQPCSPKSSLRLSGRWAHCSAAVVKSLEQCCLSPARRGCCRREESSPLAAALEKRPQLKLAIEGRFDRERDREALGGQHSETEVSKRAG